MSTPDYGVFAQLVAVAGSLMSAATAISLTWKGRAKWEPDDQDLPKGAQRVGGLISAAAIGALWWAFASAKVLKAPAILWIGGGALLAALLALLVYGILITVFMYDQEITTDGKTGSKIKIVGGFWLSQHAKTVLRQQAAANKPVTVQLLFKGSAYSPDNIWPRFGRALAKACFNLSYILLVAAGTIALTCVSLLIAGAMKS